MLEDVKLEVSTRSSRVVALAARVRLLVVVRLLKKTFHTLIEYFFFKNMSCDNDDALDTL